MIEEIIKKILIEVVMKTILSRIVSAVPFLGYPIIGPIFSMLFGKLFNMIGDELVLMVKLKQIEIRVGKEDASYTESKKKLEEVLNKPEKSEAEIEAAKEELKKNFQRLVNFNYN